MTRLRIGIDTGATFTKTPSTPPASPVVRDFPLASMREDDAGVARC